MKIVRMHDSPSQPQSMRVGMSGPGVCVSGCAGWGWGLGGGEWAITGIDWKGIVDIGDHPMYSNGVWKETRFKLKPMSLYSIKWGF